MARVDPQRLETLRAAIRRIERGGVSGDGTPGGGQGGGREERPAPLTTGAAEVDAALPDGGLARGALHEVLSLPGRRGAATGFCAALLTRLLDREAGTVLWCRRDGDLYGPGLAALGLDPARLVLVRARRDLDVLWAMEEALRSGAPAAVVGETGPGLGTAAGDGRDAITATALRRLQLAAEAGGRSLGLLLHGAPHQAGSQGLAASPALTRWRVAARPGGLPSVADPGPGAGDPRWRLELLRCRGGRPRAWDVAWRDTGSGRGLHAAAPESIGETRLPTPFQPSVKTSGMGEQHVEIIRI